MSLTMAARQIAGQTERIVHCPGVALDLAPATVGRVVFTIHNDPILVKNIFGVVTTLIGAGAARPFLQLTTNAQYGAVVAPICALSASIANVTTGTILQMTGVAAGLLTVSLVRGKRATGEATGLWASDFVILCPGVVQIVNATPAVTGVVDWYMLYVPTSPESRVTAR
jgi:hypothetical protein